MWKIYSSYYSPIVPDFSERCLSLCLKIYLCIRYTFNAKTFFFLEPVKGWSVRAGSIIGLPEATTSQPKSAYSKYNGVFRFQIVGRLSCEFKSNCGFLFASVIVLGVVFVFVDGIMYYNIRHYGMCYTKLCTKLNHPTTLRITTN